ncbi:MAG: aryl-sulfate sulfotransferase [Planctomycetota bacterium]|jgi:hypothetical protein
MLPLRSRSSSLLPTIVLALLAVPAQSADAAVILPVEGSTLQRIHVEFRWAPVEPASTYELEVVIDSGGSDPFDGATPVVDLVTADDAVSTIVTDGLAFGDDYAWRVRGLTPDPQAWGPTHRFTIAALPDFVPPMTISTSGGAMEPGLTMFNIFSFNTLPKGLAVAIGADGAPVWFITHPTRILDLRLAPNGRVLYTDDGGGFEATLDGQITWDSTAVYPDLYVHHEIFRMPNGNFLTMVEDFLEVERDGEMQVWVGDRIIEIDRLTNEIVWDWTTNEHYSTLDYDEQQMAAPRFDGAYDWTHSNAVVYNEADNSVYISARHQNRITRIDYDTRQIVYNMGFVSPSADDDFGDNLFSFQHAVQMLPNGNMMVYDNGNRRDHQVHTAETGVTKAVELAFTNGEDGIPVDASIVWEYTAPNFTPFIGDADRLPGGNTLVTVGAAAKIIEVAPDGEEVWNLSLIDVGNFLVYRSERIPSLVLPAACDCPGDLNCSQFVDYTDLFDMLDDWGTCPDIADCAADLDGDGDVTILDLLELFATWGACP